MASETAKEVDIKTMALNTATASEDCGEGDSSVIYIDPKNEAAALAKFDKTVLPVSMIFLILSSLDRNNVSTAFLRAPVLLSPDICLSCPNIKPNRYSLVMLVYLVSMPTSALLAATLATSPRFRVCAPFSLSFPGSWLCAVLAPT